MKTNLFLKIMLGVALFSMWSCQDTDLIQPEAPPISEITEDIPYGKKLENPYTVEVMKKAYDNLMSNTNARIKEGDLEITTSHYYVRFSPQTREEMELLEADSLELWPYPLDYEIDPDAFAAYMEEEKDELRYDWLYTSVPVDYVFPKVTYQTLAQLFLPEEVEEEMTQGARKKDLQLFLSDLEDEALRITGNLTEEDITDNGRIAAQRYPQGYVYVFNTQTGRNEPLVHVRVRTRRWFNYGYAYTNTSGYYKGNEDYKYDCHYSVIFVNWEGFKIWNSMIDIDPALHHVGKASSAGLNINIGHSSRAWRFAAVNNAVVEYRNYCKRFGIALPPSDIRIAASNKEGGRGAAPMLRRTYGMYGFTTNSQVSSFFLKMNGLSMAANLLGNITKTLQPDIYLEVGGMPRTIDVYALAFHELAHASHFSQVGSEYWVKYINYIITYGAYGDGHGKNAGLVALGEAWGYHMGYFLTIQEFGNNNILFPLGSFENFDPESRPHNIAVARYTNNSGWTGWIPAGIMHDLTDNSTDIIRTGFSDNVTGYTLSELFYALEKDVDNLQKFKERLLIQNGNKDKNDVELLFEAYYY